MGALWPDHLAGFVEPMTSLHSTPPVANAIGDDDCLHNAFAAGPDAMKLRGDDSHLTPSYHWLYADFIFPSFLREFFLENARRAEKTAKD
jgi:hypothetical protein